MRVMDHPGRTHHRTTIILGIATSLYSYISKFVTRDENGEIFCTVMEEKADNFDRVLKSKNVIKLPSNKAK